MVHLGKFQLILVRKTFLRQSEQSCCRSFDEGYAQEELAAELGVEFLAADLRLPPLHRDEHGYIASWIEAPKNEKRFIF